MIIVATSNRSPAQLYTGHFNDTYSTAWVALMTELCEVVELVRHPPPPTTLIFLA